MKIKLRRLSKIKEKDLVEFCTLLLCISSMMQYSILFQKFDGLIDGTKYAIAAIGIFFILLKVCENTGIIYLMKVLGLSVMIITTCILTHNFSFLLICVILVLSKNIKIEEFIRISFGVLVFFGSLHILLWIFNYFINIGLPVYYGGGEKRVSFLFTHPNIVALKLGWGIIMYTWLSWDKLKRNNMIWCYIAVVIMYVTTKSDSCIIFLLYLFLVSLRNLNLLRKVCILISKYCFLFLGIGNFIVTQLYMGRGRILEIVRTIDIIFSRRIAMSYLAIKENGISFIGKTIGMNHEWDAIFNFNGYTIDSLYTYIYVCIGIVYFLLIGVGFWQLGRYRDYRAALAVIAFSLYGLVELHCLYLSNCFVLLLLKCVIFKEKKIE